MESGLPQELAPALEALVFASDRPLPSEEAFAAIDAWQPGALASWEEAHLLLQEMAARLNSSDSGFMLVESGGGWQFLTRPEYHHLLSIRSAQTSRRRLSPAAMETLAIIAYRQPVSKPEIEAVRGVASDHALQRLLERGLVEIVGRSEQPGRPMLYATSPKMLDHLGLNHISQLPPLPNRAQSLEPHLDPASADSLDSPPAGGRQLPVDAI